MNRVTVRDRHGTPRTGPRGAWWLPIRDGANETGTRRAEIPTIRIRAWNVATIVYVAAATVLASQLGQLAPFLAIVGGLILVGAGGLWWLHMTMPTRHARQIGQPLPAKAPRPAAPSPVEARPLVEVAR